MELDIEERQDREEELGWALGGYTGRECTNCGRNRVCKCPNGLTRCEKCNWVEDFNDYCDHAL